MSTFPRLPLAELGSGGEVERLRKIAHYTRSILRVPCKTQLPIVAYYWALIEMQETTLSSVSGSQACLC
jgi:hypothetical protein